MLEIEELTGLKKPIRWCQVDVGEQTPRGVICGATNFAVGDLVVVTLPGAVLPGGFAITARKTYGHVSDGMIASVRELGIGADHAGILVLPPHTAEPGDDALPLIGAGDPVIELNITPDRGYAFSVRGLAREIATATDVDYVDPASRVARAGRRGRRVAGHARRRGLPAVRGPARERGRPEGGVAVVDAAAPARRRDAADLADRRRHQLRDAGAGPAAARLRRGAAVRADRGAAGAARRA